jgi:hypothetical protein
MNIFVKIDKINHGGKIKKKIIIKIIIKIFQSLQSINYLLFWK